MRLLLFTLALAAWAQERPAAVFDDAAEDRMRITARAYEIILSKENGAIVSIGDRAAGASLTQGSRNGCLWGSTYVSTPPVSRGGCDYRKGDGAFRYAWDAGKRALTLAYRDDATVTLTAADDFFDLKLDLNNRTGAVLDSVSLPSDLLFDAASMRGAYLPYFLPGVRVEASFFAARRNFAGTYPSTGAFADYLSFEAGGGRLAWYAVNPGGRIAPAKFGFRDGAAYHTFQTWTPNGGHYASPVVRVRVGQTVERTMLAYRADNGIDRYPSIQAKLGSMFEPMSRAPMVKMGFRGILPTFAGAAAKLDVIESPALLHPVSYWERGFDQNYPDFLPPDPKIGSTEDFRAFVDAAHQRGLFVMPYTNPTWWDLESPTARAAGDLKTYALLTADGKPKLESYGPNHGFVASLGAPGTAGRLARLMAGWKADVPVDFVLHDQIGSRPWLRDFQPNADPQTYSDRWLAFTAQYASARLMTEDGWDRLAETETGFCGSALTGTTAWDPATVRWGAGSRGNKMFGPGNWRPYPLGVWLFHDKVLFYHHDLSHPPMNAGVEVLTWNAAFGVNAGYLWPLNRGLKPEWIKLAKAYQRAVFSRTAGRMLSSYREVTREVTDSRFGDLTVTANWSASDAHETGGFTVAPSGFLARTADAALLGGVFAGRFNGAALSAGVHYLIVERTGDILTVRQPVGADSEVRVAIPAAWVKRGIKLSADGQPVEFRLDGPNVIFTCSAKNYEISPR